MILGRGPATTDADIRTEYHQFLDTYPPSKLPRVLTHYHAAAETVCRRIGKPIAAWHADDMLGVCASRRAQSTRQKYYAFLAFLIFRGYLRPSLDVIHRLQGQLVRTHRQALAPYRQRFSDAARTLGYPQRGIGHELTLLITLLAVVGKPIEAITQQDLDQFRQLYEQWHSVHSKHTQGPRLTRIEYYLVYWGYLPRAERPLQHDKWLAPIVNPIYLAAVEAYLMWCTVKYKPHTVRSLRPTLLAFVCWLQEQHPMVTTLDGVTRSMVVEYAQHIKQRTDISAHYQQEVYRAPCQFYEFVIHEGLPTCPPYNPFNMRDIPQRATQLPRYLEDHVVQRLLTYCEEHASLLERTLIILLLHTGIRGGELAVLKDTDIVQIQGKWKLHIHEGKGLKDRMIPLTEKAYMAVRAWQEGGWERATPNLFTRHGKPWRGERVRRIIHELSVRLGLDGVTPHRFRHTFAVALLNYGMRETALQKLLGHASLEMTLQYAQILDRTVEQAFDQAVGRMQDEPLSWVPNFFVADDYPLFSEGDAVGWIRLPLGYCRRNPKLHCESDVKSLLCNRFRASPPICPGSARCTNAL